MVKLGNRKTQRLSCHTLATSVSSASRPTPDIYLCSGGRPEAPHLRPPPRLPSQRRPDRAINSLQRVPPVAFAPLGRGATTEPFTAFGLPAQGSLTLPTANRPSRPPNPPRLFRGLARLAPFAMGLVAMVGEGRGKRTLPAHWLQRASGREQGELAGRSGRGTGAFHRAQSGSAIPRTSRRAPRLRNHFRGGSRAVGPAAEAAGVEAPGRARRSVGPAGGAQQPAGVQAAAAGGRRRPRTRGPRR